MALAPVDLCNRALDDIGHSPIQSLGDNTQAAKVCSRQYPKVLEELLAATDWPFARMRAALSPITSDRLDTGWYAFARPNNVATELRMLSGPNLPGGVFLGATEVALPFEIEEDRYYTRYSSVMLEYIRNDPPVSAMPPMFLKAMQAALAANIVYPLQKDSSRRNSLLGEAELHRDRAVAVLKNAQGQTYGNFLPGELYAVEMDYDL